ncbi:MAG: hypothetical protein Q8M88_04840 [Phenylobacterium sp.]|uniref:hypothetical protein n=1 Tax=Phenylobacterium sp. TaxID=1871053 RepID=UPI00273578F9|nr:hypothetical protein [Phenylobacterium sp.]MDP3173740.1 hypothetical protein [Phenylobacterium sp.]
MKTISIKAAAQGWMLRSDAIATEQFFSSGASAESAAIRLAQGLADAGENSSIEIHLRDGSLGRRFVVPALPARPSVTN